MSLKLFRLRRPPVELTARPRDAELSIKASTASCSMRFSLRWITSGAFSSTNFFKRLLRLIIRRYKSFRSDVANRPPDSATIGRRSGGITGRTVMHRLDGLIPAVSMLSNIFRRLSNFFCRWPFALSASSVNLAMSFGRSISSSSAFTALAPMPTSISSSYSSGKLRYSVSEINAPLFKPSNCDFLPM